MKKNPLHDIITRTSTDKAFREEFLRDPAGVLQRAGIQVPAGKTIKVIENSDEQIYIPLPTTGEEQPANWNLKERPAPGEKREAPPLTVEWTEAGIALSGRIDSASAKAFKEELDRVSGNLFIDFGKVVFMSSIGLSVLLATRTRLEALGKHISLYNVPEAIMSILALTNTDSLFHIYDEEVTTYCPWVMTM